MNAIKAELANVWQQAREKIARTWEEGMCSCLAFARVPPSLVIATKHGVPVDSHQEDLTYTVYTRAQGLAAPL